MHEVSSVSFCVHTQEGSSIVGLREEAGRDLATKIFGWSPIEDMSQEICLGINRQTGERRWAHVVEAVIKNMDPERLNYSPLAWSMPEIVHASAGLGGVPADGMEGT